MEKQGYNYSRSSQPTVKSNAKLAGVSNPYATSGKLSSFLPGRVPGQSVSPLTQPIGQQL